MAKRSQKTKIAIAIDNGLLTQIDALVDGTTLTSRSQAISHFLQQSLRDIMVTHAVILLHRDHHDVALSLLDGEPLLKAQLSLFLQHGIRDVCLVTQEGPRLAEIATLGATLLPSFSVILADAKGTADALLAAKEHLSHVPFVAMSGDTFNRFDLSRMILRHMRSDRLATMGLVNKEDVQGCGVVLLDGEQIIHISHDLPQNGSHIINAGIYIFRPEIFSLLGNAVSLEREVFPQLVGIRQLMGHFTHGTYVHMPEKLQQAHDRV